MNEEIFKRLQDQCWIYHTHPDMIDTDGNGDARPCGFDTKKFAELIVRECLEQIYSVTIDNPIDDWDQGYDSGLNQAAETIKEHFGTEE